MPTAAKNKETTKCIINSSKKTTNLYNNGIGISLHQRYLDSYFRFRKKWSKLSILLDMVDANKKEIKKNTVLLVVGPRFEQYPDP